MLELRRSRDRGYDDLGWLKSWYTFVYADYYDPEHLDFGSLAVLNEERLRAGKAHPAELRRDTQVLTYLIDGELRHQDSLGNETLLQAGGFQSMNAGSGIRHTESNASPSREAHLLHIRFTPDQAALPPSYEQKLFSAADKRGTLRLLASPDGANGSLTLYQDARIFGGLFHESERAVLELPKNRRAYLHVVRGSIAINETRLNVGDGVKINPTGPIVFQHGREAEIMVFEVPSGPQAPKRKSTRQT